MLALFDAPAAVAGVFTRSKCPSAPVDWCRASSARGKARALVVNSGNANAFTGAPGSSAVAADRRGRRQGDRRGAGRGLHGLDRRHRRAARRRRDRARARCAGRRRQSRTALMDAARAIMTTDTFPKVATARGQARRGRGDDQRHRQGRRHDRARHGDDAVVRLHRRADRRAGAAGAARRSRSSARSTPSPSTATPRPPTRCCCSPPARREARRAGDRRRRRPAPRRLPARARQAACSTSPSRSCATARARANSSRSGSRARRRASAAKRIALSIANSPLVKTAVAGEDANWGRVVMAVGKAGEKAERDKLDIFFGDIRVAHQGLRDPDYSEAEASAYMKKQKIVDHREARHRQRRGDGVDLRPHQGICRHQRRLPLVKLLLVVAVGARRRRQPRADRPAARRASSSRACGSFPAARSSRASGPRTR